jgi:glycosyltransferase involved in cell wall biosynthesis
MRWIVAQLGARQHYAVPVAFERLGHLRLFYTEAWCRWGRELVRLGPSDFRAFANRFHPELPGSAVKSFTPSYGAFHLAHFPGHSSTRARLYRFFVNAGAWFGTRVAEHLSRQTLNPSEDHFFAFNTGALEALSLMRKLGVFTVLDQIDPGREEERLIALEREKWPGWENFVDPVPEEYWNRIREEWGLADIVMVNSEWSKKLLICQRIPESKLIVVPLAYQRLGDVRPREAANGQLTVLWLGGVNLRKGIQYLIEAAKSLPKVRFVVAGPIGIREERVRSAPENVVFGGRVQRNSIGSLYQQAHVFVLPTLSDGFAITQLEAMAHGLPVITTSNCGEVVTDGVDGLIVPAANSEALAAAIARLDANRKELVAMSKRAFDRADQFELPKNAQQIEDAIRVFKTERDKRLQGSEKA